MRRLVLLLIPLLVAAAAPAAAGALPTARCIGAGSPTCFVWKGKVTYVADGDTVYVDVDGDGTRASQRVRLTGFNAMEQTVYAGRASLRRGECHALEATSRLESLLRSSRYRVRLLAQDPASRSGQRLRRALEVRIRGRWRDVGRTLVKEGHALWLPNGREYAWNRDYSILAARAARLQRNLWDPDYCGFGPVEGAALNMLVNWDADGPDGLDPNGEWVRIRNLDPFNAMPLGGWWLRDSALRRFVFPAWASVPPGGTITVYRGMGDSNESEHYWGLRGPAFENVTRDERAIGDGAYLFDPQGDLRLSSTYPCRENCTDPNLGVIALSAQYRGRESVELANTGGLPVDLEQYRLTSSPWGYSFSPNSVLQPGETMRIRLWESFEEDEEHLIRHWPVGPILNNAGDSLQLRRYDDVVIACTAWGTRSC